MYDCIVMLSGGKDSCALTYELVQAGKQVLAVTVDTGFLSDVAKRNIDRVVRHLDIYHIYIRPKSSEYQAIIDKGLGLIDTCSLCSFKTMYAVIGHAQIYGIKVIYAGFTKYTAMAQGWDCKPEVKLVDVTIWYPYYIDYNLQKIRTICNKLGLEFDPVKTNCKHLKSLIDRSKENPFIKEAQLLLDDKQITEQEFAYYRDFAQPGG